MLAQAKPPNPIRHYSLSVVDIQGDSSQVLILVIFVVDLDFPNHPVHKHSENDLCCDCELSANG